MKDFDTQTLDRALAWLGGAANENPSNTQLASDYERFRKLVHKITFKEAPIDALLHKVEDARGVMIELKDGVHWSSISHLWDPIVESIHDLTQYGAESQYIQEDK